jgi:hypothetical protein
MLKAAIGNAIEHWASTIVLFQLRLGNSNLREDGARKVFWRIDKSKTSKYPIQGEYYFNQDYASIDSIAEIASYCADEGVVQKGGSWIYYPTKETCGDDKWQSEAKFVSALRQDESLREQIVKELFAKGVKVAEDDEE